MQETDYLKENKRVLSLLRKIEKFENFSEDNLLSFLDLGKLRSYEPGETIIREGDVDCWIYFLITGRVEIIKGGKRIKTLDRGGDLFGEMVVVDGGPRSATIKAVTRTLALGVDGSMMDRKAGETNFNYSIFRFFSEVLVERLRTTTEENIQLRKRVAALEKELQKFQAA